MPYIPYARVSLAVLAVGVLVGALIATVANAGGTPTQDGVYACAFQASSMSCTATVAPTATVTETVTASGSPSVTPTTTTSPSPSPTQTPSGVLFGSSYGGSSQANIDATHALWPTSQLGRFYWSGDPSPTLPNVPAGQVLFVSFKTAVATVQSGAFNAAFATDLRAWNASGRVVYWTWQHEADDPAKGISPAAYVAGWDQLLSVERANPSPNVHSMTVLMAFALTAGYPHGDPASWYVPGVDVLGFDSYQLNTEKLAEQYAASKGKALAFPEWGDGTSVAQPDSACVTFAKAFVAALTPDVFGAAWFNSGKNTLGNRPQTTAYLNSLT
jgi:hypothetical protein